MQVTAVALACVCACRAFQSPHASSTRALPPRASPRHRWAPARTSPPRRRWEPARRASPADWPTALADACDAGDEPAAMGDGTAAALIAGTTVGAGVLALPAATASAGFYSSTGVLCGAWVFMAVSGLLVAEASVAVVCQTGRPDLGFLATVRALLGEDVGRAAGAAYAFLHYALLVAYAAQGGALLAGGVGAAPAIGAVAFGASVGGGVAFGPSDAVDAANNVLVGVVVASVAPRGKRAAATPRSRRAGNGSPRRRGRDARTADQIRRRAATPKRRRPPRAGRSPRSSSSACRPSTSSGCWRPPARRALPSPPSQSRSSRSCTIT